MYIPHSWEEILCYRPVLREKTSKSSLFREIFNVTTNFCIKIFACYEDS